MTLGKLNALLGLIAAASVSYYIISRAYEASAPVATVIKVGNESREAIQISNMDVAGMAVIAEPVPFLAAGSDTTEIPTWDSAPVALAPGRSVSIHARVAGTKILEASCALEQRPPGACVIRVIHRGGPDLKCAYVCEGAPEAAP